MAINERKEIVVRWLETSDHMIHDALLAEAKNGHESLLGIKVKALKLLGIEVEEGQTPSEAYLKAMCDENGLPFTLPAPFEIVDALQFSGAMKFYWWLV